MVHKLLTAFALVLCFACVGLAQNASPPNAQSSSPQPLSLDKAVRTALQQHPPLKEAEAAVAAADVEVIEAHSLYFPQLRFSGIPKVGLLGATSGLGFPRFTASPFFRN